MVKLSPAGQVLMQVGGPEEPLGPGQPTDVATSRQGEIYVVEALSGTVWWLDAAGDVRGRWPVGQANTLDSPHVAVGPDGAVYVTDPEGGRVLVFTAGGQPVGRFGLQAEGQGRLIKPVGIDVGSDGTVYVSDSQTCRVVAFGPQR